MTRGDPVTLSQRGDTKGHELAGGEETSSQADPCSGHTAGNLLTCRQGVLSLSAAFPGFTSLSNGPQLQSRLPNDTDWPDEVLPGACHPQLTGPPLAPQAPPQGPPASSPAPLLSRQELRLPALGTVPECLCPAVSSGVSREAGRLPVLTHSSLTLVVCSKNKMQGH